MTPIREMQATHAPYFKYRAQQAKIPCFHHRVWLLVYYLKWLANTSLLGSESTDHGFHCRPDVWCINPLGFILGVCDPRGVMRNPCNMHYSLKRAFEDPLAHPLASEQTHSY